MSQAVLDPPSCANCGAVLGGPFCAHCGQKAQPPDPTLLDLVREALADAFDVDGRLLRSIRCLFTRPGFLTTELIAGRRAAYVGPVRLYLTFSVLCFAVTTMVSARTLSFQGDVIDIGFGQRFFVRGTSTAEERAEVAARASEALRLRTEWLPRFMFLIAPVAGLLVMAVTRRSRRNYPQHLYFALHIHAVVFAVITVRALLPSPTNVALPARGSGWTVAAQPFSIGGGLKFLLGVAAAIYVVLAFKRVYGGGWLLNGVRAAATSAVYTVLVMAFLLALVLTGLRNVLS